MTVSPVELLLALCAGLFFLCVYLTLRIGQLRTRLPAPEVRYIDTAGVTENPPRQFIETWKGKTLNFKFDGYIVCIPMVSINEATDFINSISAYFAAIEQLIDIKKQNNLNQENRTAKQKVEYLIQEKIIDIRMMTFYTRGILTLYNLCIKNVNRRKGFRKALMKKCRGDFMFTLEVFEQINDYWQTVKKKIVLLRQGQTLKQTDGYLSTWQDLTLDKHGNKLTVPKYG